MSSKEKDHFLYAVLPFPLLKLAILPKLEASDQKTHAFAPL